jgi:hypothetical protein
MKGREREREREKEGEREERGNKRKEEGILGCTRRTRVVPVSPFITTFQTLTENDERMKHRRRLCLYQLKIRVKLLPKKPVSGSASKRRRD